MGKFSYLALPLLLLPLITSAASFRQLVDSTIVPFVDRAVIPFLYALAFLFFIMNAFRFFFSQSDEGREQGRQFAFWGIIGMVVIFAVWGIVKLFLSVLSID
jgi:hypothetical protein